MKNSMKEIQMICMTMVGFYSVTLIAQEPVTPVRGPVSYESFDVDGNGMISEKEFNDFREARMESRGKGGGRGMMNGPVFSDIDTNKDGQISLEEFTTMKSSHMAAQKMGKGKGCGQGRGPGKGKGAGNMPTFADFDGDGDGSIVEAEFHESLAKRISDRAEQGYKLNGLANAPKFSDIDTNKDGKVDSSEFDAHLKEHCQNKTAK